MDLLLSASFVNIVVQIITSQYITTSSSMIQHITTSSTHSAGFCLSTPSIRGR
jgi:hypothetical protein